MYKERNKAAYETGEPVPSDPTTRSNYQQFRFKTPQVQWPDLGNIIVNAVLGEILRLHDINIYLTIDVLNGIVELLILFIQLLEFLAKCVC